MANSLDAVSDRDFALEYLSVAAILITHMSRLAEEIVLWSSDGFGFIRLADAFSTGSSMLPHKRNPDAAELIRAKTGRVIGALTGLLVVMKGLPLAYSKDMQEDKEPVFETADTLGLCVAALNGMFADIRFNTDRMLAAAKASHSNAIDLADWLVRELDTPFREAHHISGRLVKMAEDRDCRLEDLSLFEMQTVEPRLTAGAVAGLAIEHSIAARTSLGGTAPENVKAACAAARQRYL